MALVGNNVEPVSTHIDDDGYVNVDGCSGCNVTYGDGKERRNVIGIVKINMA